MMGVLIQTITNSSPYDYSIKRNYALQGTNKRQ